MGKKILVQSKAEGANIRSSVKGFASIVKESWQSLIECIPKMIRLSVELIKSNKISDKAKFILIGGICVIAFLIAESFIGFMTIVPLIFFLAGPITAVFLFPFYGTFKLILMTVAIFIIINTFNGLNESKEVEKLVISLFGEKEGTRFLDDIQSLYDKLKKYLSPIADKLSTVFEKIGRRKKNFDADTVGDAVIRAANKNKDDLLKKSSSLQSEKF